MYRLRGRCEWLAEGPHQAVEGTGVEGECCAAPGVGRVWVWHCGELGAAEVVAVHGDEGCDWCVVIAWGGGAVAGVEVFDDCCGECGLSWIFLAYGFGWDCALDD